MDEIIKAPDISTPYTYARFTNKYSLLQQQILLKVSKHLQNYVQRFYGGPRHKIKESPQSLFTKEDKAQGVGQIRVSYAELGVAQNNFFMARKAAKEVLGIQFAPPLKLDEDGKPIEQEVLNLFTDLKIEGPGSESSAVTFNLNMKAVDLVIDISKGYVTHPENIALIANTEKLPLLYYLLKHEMENWQLKSKQLTVFAIKDFLGMVERDEHKNITKISYKKFSQFKEKVIEPTLKDLQRLRDEGLIDMSFDVKYIYAGKRQVGDPAYVQFTQVKQEKPQVAQTVEEVKPENVSSKVIETTEQKMARIWASTASHVMAIDGGLGVMMNNVVVKGFNKHILYIECKPENKGYIKDIQSYFADYPKSNPSKWQQWLALVNKHFGKSGQYEVTQVMVI